MEHGTARTLYIVLRLPSRTFSRATKAVLFFHSRPSLVSCARACNLSATSLLATSDPLVKFCRRWVSKVLFLRLSFADRSSCRRRQRVRFRTQQSKCMGSPAHHSTNTHTHCNISSVRNLLQVYRRLSSPLPFRRCWFLWAFLLPYFLCAAAQVVHKPERRTR